MEEATLFWFLPSLLATKHRKDSFRIMTKTKETPLSTSADRNDGLSVDSEESERSACSRSEVEGVDEPNREDLRTNLIAPPRSRDENAPMPIAQPINEIDDEEQLDANARTLVSVRSMLRLNCCRWNNNLLWTLLRGKKRTRTAIAMTESSSAVQLSLQLQCQSCWLRQGSLWELSLDVVREKTTRALFPLKLLLLHLPPTRPWLLAAVST